VALALEGLDAMAELVAVRAAELERDSAASREEAVEMAARLRALRQIRARLERRASGDAAAAP
jgi:nicotinamide mononucleotide (NMN) deamidase PncC